MAFGTFDQGPQAQTLDPFGQARTLDPTPNIGSLVNGMNGGADFEEFLRKLFAQRGGGGLGGLGSGSAFGTAGGGGGGGLGTAPGLGTGIPVGLGNAPTFGGNAHR